MNLFEKFGRMLKGKANEAIENATVPLEQLHLIRDEFINKIGQVNESKTTLKGELKFAKKELEEMNTELGDISKKLDDLRTFAKGGGELTDNDKAQGQKLLNKKERLVPRIKAQEAEVVRIEQIYKNLEKKSLDLDIELEKIKDKIEDAERTQVSAEAIDKYAEALELVNDETSSKSLDSQLDKINKQASVSEARAEIAESNSNSFDFDKKTTDFDNFLNS
jgi:phage shock protein A